MKPKLYISLAGLALVVLTGIQVFLISGLYQLRKNEFDNRYGATVRQALIEMENQFHSNGLDTAMYLVNVQCFDLLDSYKVVEDDSLKRELNRITIDRVQTILNEQENISPFLKAYLELEGLDNDFGKLFAIQELEILGHDTIYVVLGEEQDLIPEAAYLVQKSNALQVKTHVIEGDYFRIRFEYLVDFTHKTRIILVEMIWAFILALISIFIAGTVFMVTIRNMLKQTRLSEMKTDFINNMAHELKTPLTTISIASSTLAETKEKPNQEKIIDLSEMIRDQNKQLSKLIDHILDINLWEKDQISLKKTKVQMADLIRKRTEAFRLENANISFSLTEEIHLNGIKAEIDDFQFTIALRNLLSNALKYGGEPPVIQLDAGFEIDHVYIKVKDNGKGIRYDEQSQIFSKFYRGKDGGTKKGLGLGLFYVKEIIELHGGTVEVFSKLGQGSTFVIRLPLMSDQT